ncbi:LPS translocon maturation chaperone LptM [Glaciecola sp. 1036]
MQLKKRLIGILLLSALSACGQRGPLYLPDEAPSNQEQTPESTPEQEEQ